MSRKGPRAGPPGTLLANTARSRGKAPGPGLLTQSRAGALANTGLLTLLANTARSGALANTAC